MSFPNDPLPITGELFINGAWVDVTSYIRGAGSINIERAFRSEQGNSITVDQCNFTLNNRDGRFSNRNPNSPYYKKLGRNTKFRCSVDDTNGNALVLYNHYDSQSGYAQTTDKAVLDIVGDIDIRGDIWPDTWTPAIPQVLGSKYNETGNQRSWIVFLNANGTLTLRWSNNGTATLSADSTVAVATSGRKAWRVTLDVDNGAAGKTVTFYTSDTISGSWVQLGAVVTTATTTSIFSSTAPLTVGSGPDGVPPTGYTASLSYAAFTGSYYRFQVYTGISGTLRADANFGAQTVDATSWSDGLGTPNTWTVSGRSSLASGNRRFYGEVSEFPQVWDTTGTDIYVPAVASSIMRRIGQGEAPLDSTMYRYLKAKTSLIGYWSMEGEQSSTSRISSSISGGKQAVVTGTVNFGTDDTLASSSGVATIGTGSSIIEGASNAGTASPTVATGVILFKYGTSPGVATPEMCRFVGDGTVNFWTVSIDTTAWYVAGFDSGGSVLGGVVTDTWPSGTTIDQWISFRLTITTTGGNIAVRVDIHEIGTSTNDTTSNNSYCAGTNVGRFTYFYVNPVPEAENNDLRVAHVAMLQESLVADTTNYIAATEAFLGETAGARFLRNCSDADIDADVVGNPDDTVAMGVQPATTRTAILQECADVDGGFIYASRNFLGLEMRTRRSMYNQTTLELDYAATHFDGELKPTDDDKVLRNDVTLTRPSGGSATSTVTEGPNNISDPEDDPEGVGRYDTSYALNPESVDILGRLAQYATFLGTWDEIRFPQTSVSLERAPFVASTALTYGVSSMDIGDAYRIVNLPSWIPPDDIELLLRGTTEVLSNRGWRHTWNTQAYGPFRINDLSSSSLSKYRAGSGNRGGSYSTLTSSLTSSATSFTVTIATGKVKWGTTTTKPGNFPLNIKVGGEVMTVSAISGTSSPQTFTISARSVNGVVKAHDAGTEVQVADMFYAVL
jgi:hypothetical protein